MSKTKVITVEVIEEGNEPYKILKKVLKFHPDLHGAHIALAWRIKLKPDKDGHLVLGKCIKASDLQREFHNWDFIIVLNREVWEDSEFDDKKKCALVDHELCHAASATDEEGAAKWDDRGRRVWRVRKHDIEEFHAIINRHGCYKRDLELFAETLLKRRGAPLFDTESKPSLEVQ